MKVLLLGETGLVGLRLKNSLMTMKIPMVNLCRKDLDFLNADGDKFLSFLDGVTVIINAVGIMSDDKITMEQIHHYAPKRFANIAKHYAKKHQQNLHWINVSAIGADPNADIAFIGSKGRGDKAILDLADDIFRVHIVRPSLIFSPIGVSTRLFLKLAKLPILPLPNGGRFVIQPVDLNDVVLGIFALMDKDVPSGVIYFVGEPIYFDDYLNTLRKNMYHKDKITIINIPIKMMFYVLKIMALFKITPPLLGIDNLRLLQDAKVYHTAPFNELLGRQPIKADAFTVS